MEPIADRQKTLLVTSRFTSTVLLRTLFSDSSVSTSLRAQSYHQNWACPKWHLVIVDLVAAKLRELLVDGRTSFHPMIYQLWHSSNQMYRTFAVNRTTINLDNIWHIWLPEKQIDTHYKGFLGYFDAWYFYLLSFLIKFNTLHIVEPYGGRTVCRIGQSLVTFRTTARRS